MLRETHTQKTPDPIDVTLGSNQYAVRYNIPGLREHLLGTHSRDLTPVSRYYFRRAHADAPPVVVDFERAGAPFYVEQKRAFCHTKGIVYVPIFVQETQPDQRALSPEAFAARVVAEEEALTAALLAAAERIAPTGDTLLEELLATPEVRAACEQEAKRRTQAQNDAEYGGKLGGAALTQVLKKHQREVLETLRGKARDGRLGSSVSRDQLAHAVGG